MKRFSKIIAAVLALCVLCGIVMTLTASAATNGFLNAEPLGSNITNVYAYDFESGGAGTASTFQTHNQMFSKSSGYTGIYAKREIKTYTDTASGESNKYLSVTPDTVNQTGTFNKQNPTPTFNFSKVTLSSLDYFVIDLDISTDSYYFDGNGISALSIGIYPGVSAYTFFARILRGDNGIFYLSVDSTLDTTADLPLSSVPGVWNHITVVVKSNYNGGAYSSSSAYTYLNGEYAGAQSGLNFSGKTPDRLGINFAGLNYMTAPSEYADYSLNVDNLAINTYAAGYIKGDDCDYSISDYFSGSDYLTVPLYSCEDIIYNSSYNYTAAPAEQNPVRLLLKSGEDFAYRTVNSAYSEISAMSCEALRGASVYTYADIDADLLLPIGAHGFKIVCLGNSSVTASDFSLVSFLNTEANICYTVNQWDASNLGCNINNKTVYDFDTDGYITNIGGMSGLGTYANLGLASYTDAQNGTINKYYRAEVKDSVPSTTSSNSRLTINLTSLSHSLRYSQVNKNSTLDDLITVMQSLGTYDADADLIYKNHDYTVIDFDLCSDAYLENGKLAYFTDEISNIGIGIWSSILNGYTMFGYVVSDADGDFYLSANSTYDSSDIPLADEAGVWNHISIVIATNEDSPANSYAYTYLDGKHVKTTAYDLSKAYLEWFAFCFNDLSYQDVAAGLDFSVGFDNFSVNFYDGYVKSSDVTFGITDYFGGDSVDTSVSLYSCADVVYNTKYNYHAAPEGQYSARLTPLGSTEYSEYLFVEEALLDIANGATVETRKNILNFIPGADITSLNVICSNGAVFSLDSSVAGYQLTSTENTATGKVAYLLVAQSQAGKVNAIWQLNTNGTVTNLEICLAEKNEVPTPSESVISILSGIEGIALWEWNLGENGEFVPVGNNELTDSLLSNLPMGSALIIRTNVTDVRWVDLNGNEIETEKYYVGSEITPYSLENFAPVDVGNPWYSLQYSSWRNITGDNVASDELTALNGAVNVFMPKSTPVAALKAKFNINITSDFNTVFYVPVIDSESNISNLEVFEVSGARRSVTAQNTVTLSGEEYYAYTMSSCLVYGPASHTKGEFNYTVTHEGETYNLSVTESVRIYQYVEKVIAEYGCGSREAKLALTLLRYSNEACKITLSSTYSDGYPAANALLDAHKDCACGIYSISDAENPEIEDIDYSELENKYAIAYDISSAVPGVILYVPVSADVSSVSASLVGISGSNRYADISVVFERMASTANVIINGTLTECYAYHSAEDAISIYNLAEIMNITVTYTDGTQDVGSYSLAAYINSSEDTASLALYEFAQICKAYKTYKKY